MSASQTFWSAYFRHSLGVHWRLGPRDHSGSGKSPESTVPSQPLAGKLSCAEAEPQSEGLGGKAARLAEAPTKIVPIAQPFVFVTEHPASASAQKDLLKKMAAAVKKGPEELFLLMSDDRDFIKGTLKLCRGEQKVLFFGGSKTGAARARRSADTFGQWLPGRPYNAMVTHELEDLLANPKLKKQTWLHLQRFVGLKP